MNGGAQIECAGVVGMNCDVFFGEDQLGGLFLKCRSVSEVAALESGSGVKVMSFVSFRIKVDGLLEFLCRVRKSFLRVNASPLAA